MIQQLKKKMMPSQLIPALVVLAAALALTAYLAPTILLLVKGPEDLYSLSIDEMEGAYVKADVDMLIDWYAETVESKEGSPDKATHREYLMPVLDGIIGVEVPAFMFSDANAVMDATNDWMMYDDYEWDGSIVTVTGTIQRMDEETQGYFYEVLDAYGMTEADKDSCPPLVLRYGTVGPLEPGMHNLLLIIDGVLLLIGIVLLVKALTGSGLKQVKAYCASLPDPEGAQAQLDVFYNETPEENCLRMDRHWLLYAKGSLAWLLAADDVAWVYATTTTHRTNGIPTGRSYTVTVCGISEKKRARRHVIPVASQEVGRELMQSIYRCIPDAVYGYDPSWESAYNADPAAFRREHLEARRAAQAAESAAQAAPAEVQPTPVGNSGNGEA